MTVQRVIVVCPDKSFQEKLELFVFPALQLQVSREIAMEMLQVIPEVQVSAPLILLGLTGAEGDVELLEEAIKRNSKIALVVLGSPSHEFWDALSKIHTTAGNCIAVLIGDSCMLPKLFPRAKTMQVTSLKAMCGHVANLLVTAVFS